MDSEKFDRTNESNEFQIESFSKISRTERIDGSLRGRGEQESRSRSFISAHKRTISRAIWQIGKANHDSKIPRFTRSDLHFSAQTIPRYACLSSLRPFFRTKRWARGEISSSSSSLDEIGAAPLENPTPPHRDAEFTNGTSRQRGLPWKARRQLYASRRLIFVYDKVS